MIRSALGLIAPLAFFAVSAESGAEPLVPPPFATHRLKDSLGRDITYYLAPSSGPAPIVLVIQGSGCTEIFDRGAKGTALSVGEMVRAAMLEAKLDFTELVVEKPFASEAHGADRPSGCSEAFDKDFSSDRWLIALQAALADARRSLPGPGKTFVLGHSEGAPMAALVASHNPTVSGVGLFAGPGVSEAYDVMWAAYARGKNTEEHIHNLAQAELGIRTIMARPDSSADYAWGFTYKRWSSFFRISILDELRKSDARIYIASGTADENVPFWSSQIAVAGLLADRRPFHVRVVPDGDHSLRPPGAKGSETTITEYGTALKWLLGPDK